MGSPASTALVLSRQIRTIHFWLCLAALISHAIVESGIIPPGPWSRLFTDLAPIAWAVAYQGGALWQPPRSSWTDEQRHDAFIAELKAAGKWPASAG